MSERENTKQNRDSSVLSACKKGFLSVSSFFKKPFFKVRIVQVYLLSFVTTYVVEMLSHYRSLPQLFHVIQHPLIFLTNMLIVSLLFAPALLFRKRYFVYFISIILWLTVGVVDFIVLHNRVTPFNANDFKMLDDALDVVVHYFKIYQIILVVVLIVLAVAGIVFAAVKFPKTKDPVPFKSAIPLSVGLFVLNLMLVFGSIHIGVMKRTFPNLANAYQEFGLPYCFACSIVDKGIKKPSGYSRSGVQTVIDSLPSPTPSETVSKDDRPNIIFIQLESFFDPKRIAGIRFDNDPIPNFTHLYKNYSSGLLTVPSISAGTANTEFEVLTGMNMADFGSGEYPYRTILQSSTCESMAYNLKQLGYSCHAIHNNTASFYGRDVVFSNLGFDDYDTIETMPSVEKNALGWAKDKVLYREIISALNSTPGRDYIFAVSVQGHGKYPDEEILEDSIDLTPIDDAYDDSTIYGLKYYTSQLNEMDAFIGSLVSYLSERHEKTILVLYGDHLPGFDFEDASLTEGSLLQTEYIMWSNYPMRTFHRDLYAFQLSAYVQWRLDFQEGLLTRLHIKLLKDPNPYLEQYLEKLKVLSYDMLYGEQFCWDGKNPYEPTELTFGYYDVSISSIHAIRDPGTNVFYLSVYGENLTPYCSIYVNGTRQSETIYVSENELFLPRITLAEGDTLSIGIYSDGRLLRQSAAYTFHAEDTH